MSTSDPPSTPPVAPVPPAEPISHHPPKRIWVWVLVAIAAVLLLIWLGPWIVLAFTTTSTDDAYVNGHVTFVAPRVPGQVVRVLVDDNNRVRKGDLLVQLDKEPYLVQVNIAQAAVDSAQSDLTVAEAQVSIHRGSGAACDSVSPTRSRMWTIRRPYCDRKWRT